MRKSCFSGCLLLVLLISFQACGLQKRIEKADRHYGLGEYNFAADLYGSAYKKVPVKDKKLRSELAFKQADCYRRINSSKALFAYRKAVSNNYADSIVFLDYAQTLRKNKKNQEAIPFFEKYLEARPKNSVALNGLAAARSAPEWETLRTRYKVQKSNPLNARRYSSFSPVFLGRDADVLIFSSSRAGDKKKQTKRSRISGMPNNRLYTIRKNAKRNWEKPALLEIEMPNREIEIGVCSFTADASRMYFTYAGRNDSLASAVQIWYSNRAGGTWSSPQPVQIFKDSTINTAHPAISPDGRILYFVSDAPNGFGGNDLWRAELDGANCRLIENLGPDINTPADELFPSVRADGQLYFASDGHGGFGGLDIYKASWIEKQDAEKQGHWEVENMGIPINSNADDFGIAFEGSAEKGYFSSNREDRRGYDQIWAFELPDFVFAIEGRVLDDKGELIPNANLRMVGTDGTNAHIQAKKDGTYRLKMEKGVDYVMLASARAHLNQSYKISTEGLEESKSFNYDFYLPSIFKPVQLENIYYEFAKWELRSDSEKGLNLLLKMLNDNPNVTIELSAHTDYIGPDSNNKILSEKRANVVVDYLISKGIEKQRLRPIGYGEEQPFVVDAALAKKHKFLKLSDVLTENFILNLNPEQQELCNQINRRTEFRVLSTTYKLY